MTCKYCDMNTTIMENSILDDWLLGWVEAINRENAIYTEYVLFIDRGFLRYVQRDDSQCLEHGKKIKIQFCPFCGEKLKGEVY